LTGVQQCFSQIPRNRRVSAVQPSHQLKGHSGAIGAPHAKRQSPKSVIRLDAHRIKIHRTLQSGRSIIKPPKSLQQLRVSCKQIHLIWIFSQLTLIEFNRPLHLSRLCKDIGESSASAWDLWIKPNSLSQTPARTTPLLARSKACADFSETICTRAIECQLGHIEGRLGFVVLLGHAERFDQSCVSFFAPRLVFQNAADRLLGRGPIAKACRRGCGSKQGIYWIAGGIDRRIEGIACFTITS